MERDGNFIYFTAEEQEAGGLEEPCIPFSEAPSLYSQFGTLHAKLNRKYQDITTSNDYRTALVGDRRARLAEMSGRLTILTTMRVELGKLAPDEIASEIAANSMTDFIQEMRVA